MELFFGQDFSHVRVYQNAAAARSARDIKSNAYTIGRHIVFAPDRYAPSTRQGQRLIAHELVHVVQQSAQRLGHDAPASVEHVQCDTTETTLQPLDPLAAPAMDFLSKYGIAPFFDII